jgi:DNA helicase-2/ATP-dependent DNA helicase PcrA
LREIRVDDGALRPGDLLAILGGWKMRSIQPGQAASIAESDREHLAAAAYRRYQSSLKAKGMVDFDDLLCLTEQLFANHPAVRREEAGRFDHVMIDEYQDTNASQYHIVKGLALGHRNLCVVGDDDQSIYGWRGAEVEHILKFRRDWPEAKVVRLEDNYRSTAAILGHANRLIRFNHNRHDKVLRAARGGGERPRILQLPDEAAEAQRVVADIGRQLTMPGTRAQDFAILCRTNEQPRSFETELRRANLPYVLVGGMSFFDRREVRDLLSYLKVIENPHDEPALLRIINTPARGIGNSTVKSLLAAATRAGSTVWEVIPDAAGACGLSATAAKAVQAFRATLEPLRQQGQRLPMDGLVRLVIDRTGYLRQLDASYPDPLERETRVAALEEIVNAAASYQQESAEPSLRDFLDDIALGPRDNSDDKENQLQRDAIALMTLHSAKGLEFPHVYLVGMEEGILPHKRSLDLEGAAIDEERRLCYVGVTRAEERLTLSLTLSRRKWGKSRDTIPSRFLYEMTGQAESGKRQGAAGNGKSRYGKQGRGKERRAGPHTKVRGGKSRSRK